jgi:hypothetical protein
MRDAAERQQPPEKNSDSVPAIGMMMARMPAMIIRDAKRNGPSQSFLEC